MEPLAWSLRPAGRRGHLFLIILLIFNFENISFLKVDLLHILIIRLHFKFTAGGLETCG